MSRRKQKPTRLEFELARGSKISPAIRIYYSFMVLMIFRVLAVVAVIAILIFLVPLVVPYVKSTGSFSLVKGVVAIANQIIGSVRQLMRNIVPQVPAHREVIRWILVAISFVAIPLSISIKNRYRRKLIILRALKEYEDFKLKMHLSDNDAVLEPLKNSLEELTVDSPTENREELLKLFVETKKKLDSMGRDLAFLAIDVVDSTGMKQGEEKATIEHDFREYKKFVENKIRSQGALKSAWTPDGVMVCFPTADAAVRAAREVIKGLGSFNSHVKMVKQDFMVRCGVNHGFVYFDDTVPMEEMSDRVIDIAGHMQKHAAPNSICIAKPAVEPMEEKQGFRPSSKIVDGYEVYVWSTDVAEKPER